MGALTISLEDGFANDHVVVAVDDAVVFDDVQVSTRYQISLAREITLTAAADRCRVKVRLPERGLESSLDLDAVATPSVRVSVDGDRLRLSAADQPRHA